MRRDARCVGSFHADFVAHIVITVLVGFQLMVLLVRACSPKLPPSKQVLFWLHVKLPTSSRRMSREANAVRKGSVQIPNSQVG